MKLFLFFNRVAFLLNLLFFVCLMMRMKPLALQQELISVIVIGGWFLSIVVNAVMTVWLIILLLRKQKEAIDWLSLINMLVFIFQLFYFIFI